MQDEHKRVTEPDLTDTTVTDQQSLDLSTDVDLDINILATSTPQHKDRRQRLSEPSQKKLRLSTIFEDSGSLKLDE